MKVCLYNTNIHLHFNFTGRSLTEQQSVGVSEGRSYCGVCVCVLCLRTNKPIRILPLGIHTQWLFAVHSSALSVTVFCMKKAS